MGLMDKTLPVKLGAVVIAVVIAGSAFAGYFLAVYQKVGYLDGYVAGTTQLFEYNSLPENWRPVLNNGVPLIVDGMVFANNTAEITFVPFERVGNRTEFSTDFIRLESWSAPDKLLQIVPQQARLAVFVDGAQVPVAFRDQLRPELHYILQTSDGSQYFLDQKG